MNVRCTVAAIGLASLLLGACTGDGDETGGSPSPPPASSTATATEAATSTSPPPPAPTSPAFRAGLWLIEVESETQHTLYDGKNYPWTPGFNVGDDSVWVWISEDQSYVRYDLGGRDVERSSEYPAALRGAGGCEQPDSTIQRVTLDGRTYEANCGLVSPDGRSMLYGVELEGGAGDPAARYAAWMLDLESGMQRLVTDQLRHCGGCDGRVGPAWSPSGRYALVTETYGGPDSAVYLHDTRTGETRKVAEGTHVSSVGYQVRWSPVDDAFIAPAAGGATVLERLPEGQRMTLPDVEWPARFDPSGRLVYAPGGISLVNEVREQTLVVEALDGMMVAEWPGAPSSWPLERGIAWTAQGPAALLTAAPECEGTTLHHPLLAASRCLAGAAGAAFDSGVARVAFARIASQDASIAEWEFVVLDIATGQEHVLDGYTLGTDRQPALIRWNQAGTHLLVLWDGI